MVWLLVACCDSDNYVSINLCSFRLIKVGSYIYVYFFADEECQELLSEGSPLGRNHIVAVGCYSEVIPVIQYLCGRLTETQL